MIVLSRDPGRPRRPDVRFYVSFLIGPPLRCHTYLEIEVKTKLTITVDQDLLPKAKREAGRRGLSLSRVIEGALRRLESQTSKPFSVRWRGVFRPAERKDERYRRLAGKYL